MLDSWAAKATAAQGGKQMLIPSAGVRWQTPNQWDGEIPTWENGETEKQPVNRSHIFQGVMTLESARAVVNDAAADAVARFEAVRQRQKKRVRMTGRRRWAQVIAKTVMGKERLIALAALETRLMPQNRRKGRQQIASASRKAIPVGRFVFGGRSALRMPVGRPPLPADTWMARYLTRKARRQQKNATAIRRNRNLPSPPATKTERPDKIEILAKR